MPHTVVYIDFDVQYHVKLTRRLDDNMIYTFSRVNLRNTLAIVCCCCRRDALRYLMIPWFGVLEIVVVRHTFATTPGCSHLLLGCKRPGFKLPGFKLPGFKFPGFKLPGFKLPGFKHGARKDSVHLAPHFQRSFELQFIFATSS